MTTPAPTLTPDQQKQYFSSQTTAAKPLSPLEFLSTQGGTPAPAPVAKPGDSNFIPPVVTPTGGAQPGADLTKAGTSGFDVFGNPVKPDSSSNITAPTSTTGQTTNDTALEQDRADRDQAAKDAVTAAQSFNDTVTSIQNGAIPLDAGQNAQVEGLKNQFKQLIDQQTQINGQAGGVAQVRGFQSGAGEYDPTFQAKTIGAVASAGAARVSDLQIKMASAVAALTQSFKDNNISKVKMAYDVLTTAKDKLKAEIQKNIDDTQAAIRSAADAAEKEKQYNLDVEKFQQTKDQTAFENAFKIEQEKIEAARNTANDAEDRRHNKVSEAIDAFKAGMGAGGGGNNVGNNITSAYLTSSGNPDPVSQKMTLDGISQQYGPMTAVAIKGLADYSLNPSDWSSRAAKGLTREQAVTLAKMVDPTYNDAMYATRATYMKNLASNAPSTIGGAINSANKAINHLVAFDTSFSKLGNIYSIDTLNTLSHAGRSVTPGLSGEMQTNLGMAKTEATGVKDELARFFKGSGSTDVKSIEDWGSSVSTSASNAREKGSVQGAITLLEGQLSSLGDQYANTMGKAPVNNFLSKDALSNLSKLKNKGYEVDIPGVNFTDKNAYLKNGGSQEALSKAYQRLVQANDPNNPPTPENVLELAQIQ